MDDETRGPSGQLSEVSGVTRHRIGRMLARGMTVRAIARDLDISVSAVYQHIARLRADGELPEREVS